MPLILTVTIVQRMHIPYSGKFSHGAKFHVCRGLVGRHEKTTGQCTLGDAKIKQVIQRKFAPAKISAIQYIKTYTVIPT